MIFLKIMLLNIFGGQRVTFTELIETEISVPTQNHICKDILFLTTLRVYKVTETSNCGTNMNFCSLFILFLFVHSFRWLLKLVGLSERMLPLALFFKKI